jgi:type II secretory pathway pseudopilin PulG
MQSAFSKNRRCRIRGMTLFEVVLAMMILVGVAGGVLLTIRTSVETSVRVAQVRDDDAIAYSFIELMRGTLRSMPGNATFQVQTNSSTSPPSWQMTINEPGQALGFGRVSFDRLRVVMDLERRPGGLWALQLTSHPRVQKLGEKPIPLVLLDDLEVVSWRFYDSRSQAWQEDWQDGGFRPTVAELTLRRQGRPEIVQAMEVMPKPVSAASAPSPSQPPPAEALP